MKRTLLSSLVLGPALLLGAMLLPGVAAAAGPVTGTPCSPSCDIYATTGTLSLPGGVTTAIWGYSTSGTPGSATLPGPVLIVNEGDPVAITLHNVDLPRATSVTIAGQPGIPDLTGVTSGNSTTYAFPASGPGALQPGTYLYEAGLISGSEYQVAMGLYGVLVVRPAGLPGRAYADASTAFNDEALVVLGEIDPALNSRSAVAGCSLNCLWDFDLRYFAPKYQLINGQAYSTTAPSITATSGNQLLLRYANAGIQHHSMGVLGLRQSVLAADGSQLTWPRDMAAETIAPGQTADVLLSLPASTATSTKYALYDAAMLLNNNGTSAFGGMLTFIDAAASGTTPSDTTGPVTSNVILDTGTGALAASVTDVATGATGVTDAEYFLDTTAANGSGVHMAGATGDPATVTGTITITSGVHTVYVHGKDGAGNWGAFASVTFGTTVDTTGPTTSALVLNPNPSNGSVNVALSGTASDAVTGNGNVTAAEYTIDGGTAVAVTRNTTAPTVSLSATIAAATVNALTDGPHIVSVRSQDAQLNWGAPATISLVVDKTGPTTTGVSASPNPNNGTIPFNSSVQAVRVTASFTDAGGSTLAAAEGFVDPVGTPANGSGFPFTATDGVFNSASGVSETGYADIPLTTINQLGTGNHTISVHARDAAGNWGTMSTTILVIDKTAPTISSVTLTPSTMVFGTASTALAVSATDPLTGIVSGQYWIDGSATPPATPTAFAGTSATISTSSLAGGVHTAYVRVRDGATNWSPVSSATLTVIRAVNDTLTITANGSTTQTVNVAAPGVLTNDQPIGGAGRTAALTTAAVRVAGNGSGTISVTVSTSGAYAVTLTGVGNNNNQRAASKRGTYQFTYTMTLNGVTTAPATVTITVN